MSRKNKILMFCLALPAMFLCTGTCKKAPITAPDSSSLVVTVNPKVIPLGGESVVRVVGYKASGTPVPDGTVVYFSADLGSIETSKETKDGAAEVAFHSSDNRSGVANITVKSGNAEVSPEEITVTIGASALSSLSISADPPSLPYGGGVSTLRVVAYDDSFNPLPGVPVIITTDQGQLNSRGNVLTTGADGRVVDSLQTTLTADVTASSGGGDGSSGIGAANDAVTANVTVNVAGSEDALPKPEFTHSPESPNVGDKVVFNASESTDPDGTIVSYHWDFGDGKTGSGLTVTHKYKVDKTYIVVLTVTDNDGNSASVSYSVAVNPTDTPVAFITFTPEDPKVNETVTFDGRASTDSDGNIISYQWYFGDGNTASGDKVTHAYAEEGTYKVKLFVTDNSGITDDEEANVVVSDGDRPTASFIFDPTSPTVKDVVVFDASLSTPGDTENGSIDLYQWDFGDTTTGEGRTASHQYADDGTYVVTLTVTDNEGNQDSVVDTVTVTLGSYPTAALTVSPNSIYTGSSVNCDGSASKDNNEGGTIDSYEFNFGDGTTESGDSAVVNHVYTTAGDYTITLVVTNDVGLTDYAIDTVSVRDNQAPVASFEISPENPNALDTIRFDGSASSDPDTNGSIVSYVWDFGDGAQGAGQSVDHSYSTAGDYTVVLTVTDDQNATDTATMTVTVL